MYRFLLTPKWLGFAALMLALAATMVGLGLWQLSRYHERSAVNARIDAAARAQPMPVTQVLSVGHTPPADAAWTRVTATGRYDQGHQILARDRTVNSTVGFEVLTPLVLDDGTTLLVDRGFIPASMTSAAATLPSVPAAPAGEVTVIGRVHLPESRAGAPQMIEGKIQVKRIAPDRLAEAAGAPLYGGYLLLDDQRPTPNDPAFASIPSDHENALMNAGYVVQWWAFALIALGGFVWVARREAQGPRPRFDPYAIDDGPVALSNGSLSNGSLSNGSQPTA